MPRVIHAGPGAPGENKAPLVRPSSPGAEAASSNAPVDTGDRRPIAPVAATPAALDVSLTPPSTAAIPSRAAGADRGSVAAADQPGALVDLNTASLEQLNALRGAGLVGRAIIRGRPYTSAEDLVTKRVLNRSAFERIKDQITAR